MARISFSQFAFAVSALALLAAAACGGGQQASFSNLVDTVTLYALRNTAIRLPSAYSMLDLLEVRTDTTSGFDFAFDIDSAGTPLIYPAGVLGLDRTPGLQLTGKNFDAIHSAPQEGYVSDSAVQVASGDVFVARSRATTAECLYISVPRYGKFRVLAVDSTERSITLEGLVDLNCGFRGLDPGVPGS